MELFSQPLSKYTEHRKLAINAPCNNDKGATATLITYALAYSRQIQEGFVAKVSYDKSFL